jgi:hypothetical protein
MIKEKIQAIACRMIACMNENDMELFYSVLQLSKENKGMFTITIEGNVSWQLYEMIKPQINLEEPDTDILSNSNSIFVTPELITQRA